MMASLSSSSPGKPLRLKDFLKEEPNSDSCGGAGGFRTAPSRLPDKSVRYLLAEELAESSGGDRSLKRRRSKGALTRIAAAINAVKMLPFAASPSIGVQPLPKQGSFLSRSFSRKLRRSFWRKRGEIKGDHRAENTAARAIVRVKDIVRLRSFGDDRRGAEAAEKTGPPSPPSPVRSTHSGSTSSRGGGGDGAWSDTDSAGSDSFSCGSSASCGDLKDASPNMDAPSPCSPYKPAREVGADSITKSTSYLEPKTKEGENGGGEGMVGCPCHFEEEKDQLSPVSVMDFPFEEDDNDDGERNVGGVDPAGGAATPTSFHRSLANLERTKHQLLQRIREFESLAALVDPVDLDTRFASSEDENEPAHEGGGDADEAGDRVVQFQAEVEEGAFALLRELQRRGGKAVGGGGCADELLVDFFIERLSSTRREDGSVRSRVERRLGRAEAAEEEALLRAAEDWIVGRRRGVRAQGWEAEVKEMEMDGRWRCGHADEEEEEEIAGDLGGCVLETLLDELLADFMS